MRIVDWSELSRMEVATIFQDVWPMRVGELQILGNVLPHGRKERTELVSARLMPVSRDVEALSLSPDEYQRLGLMECDYVVEQPSGHGREPAADAGRRWLVWEQADRERVARWLLNPGDASAEQNAGHHVLLKVEA
ncbi:hypothetical protein [Methylobacterium sp. WCS2018Hpa-22]|uniref:hypothetical protein n=1 Tax=Methylobacterium sp. WCS2018Hpa-22 TaxID=3073633 RepID=UPI00288B4ABC|nr:hypothetical protein [Methylobacterium sp. WCS2018Hpa-22]